MHILITGATGLIGSQLIALLATDSHTFTIATRNTATAQKKMAALNISNIAYLNDLTALTELNHVDAIINLAGEPIADKRWTAQQKKRICDSRWNITQQLVTLIAQSDTPPAILISGSAVGFYGDQRQQRIDDTFNVENSSFTHQVCATWEGIAQQAASEKTRVCLLRTGVVLANEGGAIQKMKLPYQLGLGGKIGSGEQYMPWIHIADMVAAIRHILLNDQLSGPINVCAPYPVKNQTFSATLAQTLRRPHWLFTPTWLINALMGESAELLTDSIRAEPIKLLASSFQFQYPQINQAFQNLLGKAQDGETN
jgi:uncharacterized protein (TIGR01777 family)